MKKLEIIKIIIIIIINHNDDNNHNGKQINIFVFAGETLQEQSQLGKYPREGATKRREEKNISQAGIEPMSLGFRADALTNRDIE